MHGVRWVGPTGVVAGAQARHIAPTRFTTTHYLSGHSLSPAAVSLLHDLVHILPTRASWLAPPLVHRLHQHGGGLVDHTSAVALEVPHTTSRLCHTSHCFTGRSSLSAPLLLSHLRCTPPTRSHCDWSTAYSVGWVDETSVAHTVGARHAPSPLCTVQHLPLPHWSLIITCIFPSSSPQVHTPPTRASWLALPLVHLLHQNTALGGSIKSVV